jgi:hypothetical protein
MGLGRHVLAALVVSAAVATTATAGGPAYVSRSAGPWGAAVQLPATWKVVVVPTVVTRAFLARTERENPIVQKTLPGAVQIGVKMFAYEPLRGRFAANLNMIVETYPPGMTLREWLFQGASAAFRHVGTTTSVRIGGIQGVRYVSTKAVTSGTLPLLTEEFAVVRGGHVYLFTYTALAKNAASYRPVFEHSAASIRFLPTA